MSSLDYLTLETYLLQTTHAKGFLKVDYFTWLIWQNKNYIKNEALFQLLLATF